MRAELFIYGFLLGIAVMSIGVIISSLASQGVPCGP